MLEHQLMTLMRKHTRAPRLTIFDRFLFGYLAFFISKARLQKIAVSLKPATILKFIKRGLKENIETYILVKQE